MDRNSLNDEINKTSQVSNDDFSRTKAIPEIPSRQVTLDIEDEIAEYDDDEEDEDLEDNEADNEAGTEVKKRPEAQARIKRQT